jgi:1-acyl-sn-glycerol-3-phosphate acyltransferase
MRFVGRILLGILANVEIRGKEKLPKEGPIILAGNHAAVLEAVMMAVYTPGIVEFFGTGDIPFDPNYAWIANSYGLIPVNRGNLDRQSLNKAVNILEQNGILGIFPEGGTWDPTQMEAQTGVAWLSYKANTPILPIGFGGVKGGLQQALKLKHPKLTMNVGDLLPPVKLVNDERSMKAQLENSAQNIMGKIKALIPEEDLQNFRRRIDEEYDIEIEILSEEGPVPLPEQLRVPHGFAYARLLFNPTLLDVLYRNLKLPIKPLKQIYRQTSLTLVLEAWTAILDYLQINPGFFTYRFGMDEGLAVKESLLELCRLGEWARESGYALTVDPIRRFRNANTGAQVVERGGCFPNSL